MIIISELYNLMNYTLYLHFFLFFPLSHDKHFQTSPKYSGLDLSLARLSFKKLVKRAEVLAEVFDRHVCYFLL